MKVLLQRVLDAKVEVSGKTIGKIDAGLLLFVGFTRDDNPSVARKLAQKVVNLRVFPDEAQRLQYSVVDQNKQILAVPQFTLYASMSRGRRPDFTQALNPDDARNLFLKFVDDLSQLTEQEIETGEFGALMKVALNNDGPFTIMLELRSDDG